MSDESDKAIETVGGNPREPGGEGAHGNSDDPKRLIAAAEAGDAFAQYHLAEAYRKGDNLPKDLEAALRWYRAAAEQGYAKAQNDLGSMYLNGMGTPENVEEAIRWYRAAADQDQADAMFNLGVRYRNGSGVAQDYVIALSWFGHAALAGCKEAMSEVGTAYRFGHGVPQDFEDAATWHIDSAKLGDVVAMGNLSDYREDLEMLALDGSAAAARHLAKMYEGGLGVEQDNALLYAWVRWGLREGKVTPDDDSRENFSNWLERLKQDLPAEDQRCGLRAFNQLKVARDALHRDWSKAAA